MKLLPHWRAVATRAWSSRLIYASIVLTALELVIPFFADEPPFGMPKLTFAALALATSIAAGVARLVAQRDVGGER